jgi:hypothetical protein
MKITEEVILNFVSQEKILTFDGLREICRKHYSAFQAQFDQFLNDGQIESTTPPHQPLPHFNCSDTFLRGFMKRNGLSFRQIRCARRPEISAEETATFLEQIDEAFQTTPPDFIINCDETPWRICQPPKKTITKKGTASVKISIKGDTKASFTMIAAITAANEKLPLFFIAKGKTCRCHKQFGKHQDYEYDVGHSPSGWATQPVFLMFLRYIRYHRPGPRIKLVMDQFPVYMTDETKATADRHRIDIIFVPAGGTSRYQPLDRLVFGALKKISAANWSRLYTSGQLPKQDKVFGAQLALESWSQISESVLIPAWDVNDYPENEEPQSNSDPEFRQLTEDPSSTTIEELHSD